MPPCILSVGHSPELLKSRTLLLESAGYVVREESNCSRALDRALADDFDLVLLCHTLSKSEMIVFLSSLAESKQLLPVLCIRKNEFCSAIDGSIPAPRAPGRLLAAIELGLSSGCAK